MARQRASIRGLCVKLAFLGMMLVAVGRVPLAFLPLLAATIAPTAIAQVAAGLIVANEVAKVPGWIEKQSAQGAPSTSSIRKQHAANPQLIEMLESWQEDKRRFDYIYIYKTPLTSGENENNLPDAMEILHHQGVIMRHRTEGHQPRYLKMDYGNDGLAFDPFLKELPNISDRLGPFEMANVLPAHSDPMRLVHVLDGMDSKPYNVATWNCQCFAAVMWGYFHPGNTGWVPDIHQLIQNVYDVSTGKLLWSQANLTFLFGNASEVAGASSPELGDRDVGRNRSMSSMRMANVS